MVKHVKNSKSSLKHILNIKYLSLLRIPFLFQARFTLVTSNMSVHLECVQKRLLSVRYYWPAVRCN